MKRAKLFLFPLLFIIALAGSAFTRQKASAAASYITAYYLDNFGFCKAIVLSDGKCLTDNLNYVCTEYVPDLGKTTDMYQNNIGNTCFQPYYSYFPY